MVARGTFVGLRQVQVSRQEAAAKLAEFERKAALEKEMYEQRRDDQTRARREEILMRSLIGKEGAKAKSRGGKDFKEAAQSVKILDQMLDGLNLTKEQELYFSNLKSDPFAVKDSLDLRNKLEQKLDTRIDILDIPLIQGIVMSPAPEIKKIDYMSEIFDTDLLDDKSFFEISTAIESMVTEPGRNVFTYPMPGAQVDPSKIIKLDQDQLTIAGALLNIQANKYIKDNKADTTNPQVVKTQTLLDQMNSPGNTPADNMIRQNAFRDLFLLYGSPEQLYDMEMSNPDRLRGFTKNPYIQSLFEAYEKYEPLDTTNPTVQNTITNLIEEPSKEAIAIFNLTFGPKSAEQVLQNASEGMYKFE